MNYLTQIILAARNRDAESWMNILFIVVGVVIYLLVNLAKAKAKKRSQQDQAQPGRKPGFKPSQGARQLPKTFQQKTPVRQIQRPIPSPVRQPQPPRRRIARPQPAGRQLPVETERAIRLEAAELPQIPKLSPQKVKIQPDFEEMPEFTAKTVEKLRQKQFRVPAEKKQPPPAFEPLLDVGEPDKLKRAILHYEILGKPLSLRGPSEHIIGL